MPPMPADNKSPFAQHAAALAANGYAVLPILPRDKAPGQYSKGRWQLMSGWAKHRDQKPEAFLIRLWSGWQDANIGVVTGTRVGEHEFGCLDFDTDDLDILERLESAIPPSRVRKRGNRGYTAFYRFPVGYAGQKWFLEKKVVCEFLTGNGVRQTVVPPSIHPTGKTYTWDGPDTLENTTPAELPVITAEDLDRLIETLEMIGATRSVAKADAQSHGDDHGDMLWNRVNAMALADLGRWFPVLGLPKTRAKPNGGYEAVASWRPSGRGRPVEQRSPNLSAISTGIRDFGTDQSYSPIDVVMAAQGWPFDHALQWLAERFGIDMNEDLGDWPEAGIPVSETQPQAATEPDHDHDTGEIHHSAVAIPGLVGDITDWIMASARQPNRPLAIGAALAVVGTLVGRRIAGPTLSGTHLYTVMLARSGDGKDHPLKQVVRLLDAANQPQLVGPDELMSQTAVIKLLTRLPVNLCPIDELGAFLAKLANRRASTHEKGISKTLRTAWGRSFDMMLTPEWGGQASERIPAPAMSILGVSTDEEFFGALTGSDVINGFLNRFLMIRGDAGVADREPAVNPHHVPDGLRADLVKLFMDASKLTEVEMSRPFDSVAPGYVLRWDMDAQERFEALKDTVAQSRQDADASPFYARTNEMAVRIATIIAAGRFSPVVDLPDMEFGADMALQSAVFMRHAAGEHMAANERSGYRNRILRFVRNAGKAVTRRDIQRFLKAELDSRTLKDILEQMVEAGDIRASKPEKPVIGRPPSSPSYSAV